MDLDSTYKKTLQFTDLILANIGYIIGAGIFVLIGKTINIAGNLAWVSVILSGLFIYFISSGYIRIHDKYLTNDAEFIAIKNKFGELISKISVIITLLANIAIIYVVILGFGSYGNSILDNKISSKIVSIIGLILAVIINIYGIELTADINNIFTISGIIGLLILIYLGFVWIFLHKKQVINKFKISSNDITFKTLRNILLGAFIFIFAYFGFELIIRLNAESVDSTEDIPQAMKYSIWISIIIYTCIALVIIGIFDTTQLTTIKPLSLLIEKLTTNQYLIKYIEFCGVGLTWNTILLSITYCSRLLTEFISNERNNNILAKLSIIDKTTQTPINSILFIGLILLGLILGDVNILSGTVIANGGLILIMCLVYLSS